MSARSYRRYLAVTDLEQRLEHFGAEFDDVWLSYDTEGRRERIDSALERGDVPMHYKWPEVRATLSASWVVRQLPDDLLGYIGSDEPRYEEREKALQAIREKFIFDFVEEFPDAVVVRNHSESSLYWDSLHDTGVTLVVGLALCERVLIREDVEEVTDPEALREAMKSLPKVTKVTPVYEWRCNDAELTSAS